MANVWKIAAHSAYDVVLFAFLPEFQFSFFHLEFVV